MQIDRGRLEVAIWNFHFRWHTMTLSTKVPIKILFPPFLTHREMV
jgi:hypothetical protein